MYSYINMLFLNNQQLLSSLFKLCVKQGYFPAFSTVSYLQNEDKNPY